MILFATILCIAGLAVFAIRSERRANMLAAHAQNLEQRLRTVETGTGVLAARELARSGAQIVKGWPLVGVNGECVTGDVLAVPRNTDGNNG